MEAGLASDEVAIAGEGEISFGNDGGEVFERVEERVDDRLVDVHPQRLRRLQFWLVGRQVDEADALGDRERRSVLAGAVDHASAECVGIHAALHGTIRDTEAGLAGRRRALRQCRANLKTAPF